MKISRAQAEENRQRILTAAAELFRARGFEAVSVAEVMAAAGLTHGGFYNHFGSKEALAAEALSEAWSVMAVQRARAADLSQLLEAYLSPLARAHPGKACPAAALAGDVRRQPEPIRQAFAEGLEAMIASLEDRLDGPKGEGEGDPAARRARAVALATRMIGALMLSRAVPQGGPLADELLGVNLAAALAELETS